jgi:hypothetical protein
MDTYQQTVSQANVDFNSLISRVKDPATGFAVKDRTYRLKSYPKCFVGSEAVQWLLTNVAGISERMEVAIDVQLRRLTPDSLTKTFVFVSARGSHVGSIIDG